MLQITAASETRSSVESKNAPHGPEVPSMRAIVPSSKSTRPKIPNNTAPSKKSPRARNTIEITNVAPEPNHVKASGVIRALINSLAIGSTKWAKVRREFGLSSTMASLATH